jgi:type IV pilus assembly protein PilW
MVPGSTHRNEAGVTLVEFLVSSFLFLIVALSGYAALDYGKRTYSMQQSLAKAQQEGRAAFELMASEIRMAGYNPLGVPMTPLPTATATTVRILADLNGNGIVGTSTEPNETITYRWVDPDGDGVGTIERGADYNGDGDFTDSGEFLEVIAENITRADTNGDGIPEDIFQYDVAPPNMHKVTITFSARTGKKDLISRLREIVTFKSDVHLRNIFPS